MSVPSEPFAAVYEDRNRLGVILARIGGRLRGLRGRRSLPGIVSDPARADGQQYCAERYLRGGPEFFLDAGATNLD
jgi:hypothetical protein